MVLLYLPVIQDGNRKCGDITFSPLNEGGVIKRYQNMSVVFFFHKSFIIVRMRASLAFLKWIINWGWRLSLHNRLMLQYCWQDVWNNCSGRCVEHNVYTMLVEFASNRMNFPVYHCQSPQALFYPFTTLTKVFLKIDGEKRRFMDQGRELHIRP